MGYLRYLPPEEDHYLYLYILTGLLVAIVIVLVVLGLLLRRRNRLAVRKLQTDTEDMELRIKMEFRQGACAYFVDHVTEIDGFPSPGLSARCT